MLARAAMAEFCGETFPRRLERSSLSFWYASANVAESATKYEVLMQLLLSVCRGNIAASDERNIA
ncbi:hypothetical protein HGP17_24730 [Rhizobium sp. P38BS-XIX]|uniref:hypothetical protein n=1 Tax=Rhizobium sp. P38BS-XIX TaxID=2726740 RepID=UPI001456BFF1|nr:hypothetical protein [Rhizobium sp. P38BS-XIX]NLS00044.1 hypothetical protein [Rhizobium sp. P38BS-XIX]